MPRKHSKARPPAHHSALTEIKQRLRTEQLERNLAAFAAVHSASLHWTDPTRRQAGPDKQETPGYAGQRSLPTASPVQEALGGCSPECA